MSEPDEAQRGAAIYSRPVLALYDLLVVRLSNDLAWRCHRERLLDLYRLDAGRRHLDVGPGTGWYLAHAGLPPEGEVTLLDLNPNSLARAESRIADRRPRTVTANVLDPLPAGTGPFDSIAANYVFHCVPGTWSEKGVAFGHLAAALVPGGVLFGGTILGKGVTHNAIGRRLMTTYNARGIFHNADDDAAGLEAQLRRYFTEVAVDVVGVVARFRAFGPRHRQPTDPA